MIMNRRSLILGASALILSPAIVRATSLMQLRGENMDPWILGFRGAPNYQWNISLFNNLSIRGMNLQQRAAFLNGDQTWCWWSPIRKSQIGPVES
jgi:hypothetical protein